MEIKVKDLTVKEFQSLIAESVRVSIEDLIEDILALSSPDYLHSIEEARDDYKKGKVKNFDEIFTT